MSLAIPDELIIATGNPGKLAEFETVLKPLGIHTFSKKDFPDLPDPVEDGDTLRANALIKAKSAWKHTGKPALADDTGLEVDALDGRPGVKSARYAGEDGNADNNMNKLLQELAGKDNRKARFRTVLCLYSGPETEVHYFEGICGGEILEKKDGLKGFGYDPIFKPDGHQASFATMSASGKNKISHRGKAVISFQKFLSRA